MKKEDTLIIKRSVWWYAMHPDMTIAYDAWQDIVRQHGIAAVITSARDGRHVQGSQHYMGRAIDLRTRDLPQSALPSLAAELRERLGEGWIVLLEPDHIHVHLLPPPPK